MILSWPQTPWIRIATNHGVGAFHKQKFIIWSQFSLFILPCSQTPTMIANKFPHHTSQESKCGLLMSQPLWFLGLLLSQLGKACGGPPGLGSLDGMMSCISSKLSYFTWVLPELHQGSTSSALLALALFTAAASVKSSLEVGWQVCQPSKTSKYLLEALKGLKLWVWANSYHHTNSCSM